jgi:hypothetical protein
VEIAFISYLLLSSGNKTKFYYKELQHNAFQNFHTLLAFPAAKIISHMLLSQTNKYSSVHVYT